MTWISYMKSCLEVFTQFCAFCAEVKTQFNALVSTDVLFSQTTQFFYAPPISISRREEDEWLVYPITYVLTKESDVVPPSLNSSIKDQLTIVSKTPTPIKVSRPPIVQVYLKRWEVDDTCPAPIPLSSYSHSSEPPQDCDLLKAFHKGTRSCKSSYSINTSVSYGHLF